MPRGEMRGIIVGIVFAAVFPALCLCGKTAFYVHMKIFTEDETMSVDRVRAQLGKFGLENRIREFAVSSATVELAAKAVGVEPARIAKTLSFHDGDGAMLIVAAGDAKIDNARFKAVFHQKARMLSPEAAVQMIGHAVGGVCPFAVPENVKIFLDESLRRFDTVFPAAGSANSAIELSCDELQTCAGRATWVDVCKGWRENPQRAISLTR